MKVISIKTLIVVSHPEINNSQTEEFLQQAAKAMEDVTWHHVESLEKIDVDAEHKLLKQADRIIFQFPLYWYSAPAGLKHWIDTVMGRNFVYGDEQYNLEDKEFGLVVTTGMPLKDFQVGGSEGMSLDQIMTPYRAFAKRAKMIIMPIFTVAQFWYQTEPQQMKLLIDYQRYINQKYPDSLNNRQDWFEHELTKFVSRLSDEDERNANLVLETFREQIEDLDQLNDTLKMIKKGEDDNLE
ncbi:NAD(P)H-dependent oxidoreductase [Companilactobacillus mishanensis]|uniref:NAD(P)H-dependent oxidoreductase n=1 Tax=Companilactobacillus mishanensis TaxID=2486008 RepID=UPI00129819FB|nr:NAD(P)H-dependent oxidoreductase [Companilactobacillus mishanensis]MQS90242.1 NAD(P)H-dependent oxidoreductase [Companilactobacillus mishanensis]